MTTATLPRRIIRPVSTSPARRSFLLGFLLALAVGLLGLAGASGAVAILADGEVLSGVRIGSVDLAGLDRTAAEARLVEELPAVDAGHVTIDAGGAEQQVTYEELGRRYDLDAMVDAAFAVGRGDGLVADAVARLRTLAQSTTLPVLVHAYDDEALVAAAARVADTVSTHPVEARVDLDGYEVRAGAEGRVLDAAAVRDAIAAAVAGTSPADVRVELPIETVAPVVSTEEAEAAAEAARGAVADLSLTIPGAVEGEEPLSVSAETIASWITFGPQDESDYAMRIDQAAAHDAVASFAESVNRAPVDARFTVAGSGLGGVVPAQDGRQLNVDASVSALLDALAQRSAGASVSSLALAVDVTEPGLTTAEAQELLPQMRMVSAWTTNYVPGEGNGFGANISIPAWDLDGYNVAPGAVFSFWEGVGPITVERGYTYGGAIINGRSTQGVALAGGICSTSTTLFNAAMRFGLEIVERAAHYYYIDRYPTGLDATVSIFDNWVTDMKFRNDTPYPIVIRGFGSPGQVTFQLWSIPNGRTVALSDPYITDRRSAIDTTQVDPSLAPGTARRVEYPHDGFKVTVSRTVYGPDGGVLHQNTWFSDYRTVNGITLVGPRAAAPAPPADDGDTADAPTAGDPPADDGSSPSDDA